MDNQQEIDEDILGSGIDQSRFNDADLEIPPTTSVQFSSFSEDQNSGEEEDEEEEEEHDSTPDDQLLKYQDELIDMDKLGLIDIGRLASWKLSSFKPGFGVEQIQSDDPQLFWQSDGPQPHYIDLHFSKKVSVERISIYVDYSLDESYTPEKVSVSSGTGFHDLHEIATAEIGKHIGWYHIGLNNSRADGVTKTFFIRFSIVSNHQSGKDTHIRALKVFSPINRRNFLDDGPIPFTTISMLSESTIR